jgi:hypothetical protein
MVAATFLATPFIPLFYVAVVRLFGRKKAVRPANPGVVTESPSEAH